MTVDMVKDATTANSAVHYQLTIRVWPDDLKGPDAEKELYSKVVKAINGIAHYREGK